MSFPGDNSTRALENGPEGPQNACNVRTLGQARHAIPRNACLERRRREPCHVRVGLTRDERTRLACYHRA
jgi:hypothetical protein